MKFVYSFIVFCLIFSMQIFGQKVTLDAGVPQISGENPYKDNTYQLINSKFALPNRDVVETPDCAHPDFGQHIRQEWDAELNSYVFAFYMHRTPDNDRCLPDITDRQRNEIKTYDGSPENLKATLGETVTYKWKFKLDAGFVPSRNFCHIHQIKAVGGSEESMPLITFCPRKGSGGNPDKFQLMYAENSTQSSIYEVNLSEFKGHWADVTEVITYGEKNTGGNYSVEIKRINDGAVIFSYSNNNIRTWKTDATFLRPKWGIYRSIADATTTLRDERVLFNNFSIEEGIPSSAAQATENTLQLAIVPNPAKGTAFVHYELPKSSHVKIELFNSKGQRIAVLVNDFKPEGKHFAETKKQTTGNYLIRLQADNQVVAEKFIQQ